MPFTGRKVSPTPHADAQICDVSLQLQALLFSKKANSDKLFQLHVTDITKHYNYKSIPSHSEILPPSQKFLWNGTLYSCFILLIEIKSFIQGLSSFWSGFHTVRSCGLSRSTMADFFRCHFSSSGLSASVSRSPPTLCLFDSSVLIQWCHLL